MQTYGKKEEFPVKRNGLSIKKMFIFVIAQYKYTKSKNYGI